MLTYTTYITSIMNLMPTTTGDVGFNTAIPNMIDDAEQRLYRELQLLNTITVDASATFSTGTRTFPLPTSIGTFYVVEAVYAITPAGTSNPDNGTRNFLTPASRAYLDATFPSSTGSTVPQYWAPTTQTTIIVAPWPDQTYQAEVVGTIRPGALSTSNTTTLLSVYFPDLFIAASMIWISAFMQNFGAAGYADNAPMAVNWEQHFNQLLKSAQTEEAMKKFTSQGRSSKEPASLATPPRT